ncbi:MAG: metallophosphoesterase [Pseudomonadota bacterium]
MLKSLFKKNKAPARTHAVPEGHCAYVIGDVHGCLDPLDRLLARIETRVRDVHPELETTLVFVGDLIDRGGESARVVDRLRVYDVAGIRPIFLIGNHEEIFLDVLKGDVDALIRWFQWGGRDTARSYGVDNLGEMLMAPDRVLHRLIEKVPREHVDFVKSFKPMHVMGDYVFVHAGLRPKVALDAQSERDMRWIRDEFLRYGGAFPLKVVHGHSIVEEPENRSNRVSVDTGVYKPGGALTAAFLAGDQVEFLSEPARVGG